MKYGTHQTPWDLRVLLYKRGAALRRPLAAPSIDSGKLGSPLLERVPLLVRMHEAITSDLVSGVSPSSVVAELQPLWKFVRWVDEHDAPLTIAAAVTTFREWTEVLLHRVRIRKNLSGNSAYSYALAVATIVARALRFPHANPGKYLLQTTRISAKIRERPLGAKSDTQNLEYTFEFGNFLKAICDGLTRRTLRGPLPVKLKWRSNRDILISSGLKKPEFDFVKQTRPSKHDRAAEIRKPLKERASLIADPKRSAMLNLRIEAELLLFVAQTGMNVTQAAKLPREQYRWQSVGDEIREYRVYKRRRGGEAIFMAFREYRQHYNQYVKWLEDVGLADDSERLFPFVSGAMEQAPHAYRSFSAVSRIAKVHGIKFIGTRDLRKTRVNWLLRASGDPDATAAQAAHSKETLLKEYARPHHQVAAAEIIRYHKATDPTFSPPGDGVCINSNRAPLPIPNIPPDAPIPDCISPEGCLFCVFHRDVKSQEYCWKLASHMKLKALELALYRPSSKSHTHPANRVIDRANEKLAAIGNESKRQNEWVRRARDDVRAGKYHPMWDGFIQLMEFQI